MNTNSNIEELVSRYLEGEMSDIEKLDFENQLVNNQEVREEFQLQKDVLEGIRDFRKAELKARLDKISIPSSNVTQYLALKIAALVTITTMIGFGAYFAFVDNDQQQTTEVSISDNSKPNLEESVPEVPKAIENTQELTPDSEAENKKQEEEVKAEPKVESQKADAVAKTESKTNATTTVPAPKIVKPDFVEDVAEENIDHKGDSFDLNSNSLANVDKMSENKIAVETVFDKKKDFHYKFFNKKLYLYGDFEDAPYEIIEYNSNNNKLYFLYYDGKFYELENEQMKISPLVQLKDEDLIKELQSLRK